MLLFNIFINGNYNYFKVYFWLNIFNNSFDNFIIMFYNNYKRNK
uniref:Uncharacterized protein n=1 Tax=viral metagenome TaxID=1070528 RepID=A0A6C0H842_9ZZZZ